MFLKIIDQVINHWAYKKELIIFWNNNKSNFQYLDNIYKHDCNHDNITDKLF